MLMESPERDFTCVITASWQRLRPVLWWHWECLCLLHLDLDPFAFPPLTLLLFPFAILSVLVTVQTVYMHLESQWTKDGMCTPRHMFTYKLSRKGWSWELKRGALALKHRDGQQTRDGSLVTLQQPGLEEIHTGNSVGPVEKRRAVVAAQNGRKPLVKASWLLRPLLHCSHCLANLQLCTYKTYFYKKWDCFLGLRNEQWLPKSKWQHTLQINTQTSKQINNTSKWNYPWPKLSTNMEIKNTNL